MSTHNICFRGETGKIFTGYPPLSRPMLPPSDAQLDAHPTGDQEVVGSTPPGRQHSFVEIDHGLFSMVILSLPRIQKGNCQFLAKAWPVKVWLGKLTMLHMSPLG